MSTTFSLVCRETRKKVWIGQGGTDMTNFYYGDPAIMKRLNLFLSEHIGKPLVLVSDHDEEAHEYEEYREDIPEAEYADTNLGKLHAIEEGKSVVLPKNVEHAKAMILVAQNYLNPK